VPVGLRKWSKYRRKSSASNQMVGCEFPPLHGASLDSILGSPVSSEADNKAGVAGKRATFSLCRVDEWAPSQKFAVTP
jgi:hypothetical protein